MRKLYLIFAVLVLALVGAFIYQSGVFDADPIVDIKADNCYSDTLHVISDIDYKPYSFIDENGNMAGHDIELIALVANDLHMNLDLILLPWDDGIAAIAAGKADVLLTCDYSDTFKGVDALLKAEPVSTDDFIVYSKKRIKSSDELYEMKCAVMENGNVLAQIKMLNLHDNCIMCSDNRNALVALEKGVADCAIMRYTVGESLLKELGYKDISSTISIGQSHMCFGIASENKELTEKINVSIERLKVKGTVAKLHKKWLTTFIHTFTIKELLINNHWLLFFFGMAIVIILFLFTNNEKRKVDAEKERHQYVEIVENLANDFECVNYVELQDDKLKDKAVLLRTSDILKRNIPEWSTEKNLSKRMEIFTNTVVPPEDRDDFRRKTTREVVLSNLDEKGAYFVNFKAIIDGEPRYYQVKFSTVKDENKNVKAIVIGVHDVDESTKKELAIQNQLISALAMANEEKQHNDTIHDIIHSGKWSFFLNDDDEIVGSDVSDEVNAIINNDVKADGYAWLDIVHPEDREYASQAFYATIKDRSCNTPYDVVYRMATKEGEYRWFHSAGRIIRDKNGNGEFFGIHIDVTEEVEKQQAVAQQIKELNEKLLESSIKSSINQMQPHFLYNALASIREVVLDDPEYASDLIYDFTTHLRACIKSMDFKEPVPFEQELTNIKAYVNIEKMRFGDRLNMVYDLGVTDFKVVALGVQPLVENAIKHGACKRGPKGGTVTLKTFRDDDGYINIQVIDDGVGFDYEQVKADVASGKRDSTGLKNFKFRFEKMLNAKVNIDSKVGAGTTVSIRFKD